MSGNITHTIVEWSSLMNMPYSALMSRFKNYFYSKNEEDK